MLLLPGGECLVRFRKLEVVHVAVTGVKQGGRIEACGAGDAENGYTEGSGQHDRGALPPAARELRQKRMNHLPMHLNPGPGEQVGAALTGLGLTAPPTYQCRYLGFDAFVAVNRHILRTTKP